MADESTTEPASSKRILLLTNIEHGESNVFLATCPALFELDAEIEVHFATFGGFEPFVDTVWEQVRSKVPQAKPITYHVIKGMPGLKAMQDSLVRQNVPHTENLIPKSFTEPPGISNTPKAIHDSLRIFIPYTGPQLVEVFSSIVDIIKTVDADLVAVNSLMTPALTACYHLGVRFTCLSPNAIKEFSAPLQPRAASLWKYPALFSAHPFPVPWHLIPFNIYFVLYTILSFARDKERRKVAKHLQLETGAILRTPVDLLRNRPPSLKILVSTLPELDFPAIVPSHVIPCGPIIRDAPALAESDPALQAWLAQGPTIYINLGSICRLHEAQAAEIAQALKTVMKSFNEQFGTSRLQVLWKLKKAGKYNVSNTSSKLHGILGDEMNNDTVRISDWLKSEPISILQSGHIVCSIHHGGANSFNEAIYAGVPHIVLPQWTDCYDYAQRVEMLGVGRWGSRHTKPNWTSKDLSHELSEVLLGLDSQNMKQKARDLADLCQKRESGAVHAAKYLLAECNEEWINKEEE